jgi:ATP-dependent RNA helicase RhlE
MNFADLGLIPELLRAVSDAGYTVPTPIQQQAIPAVLAGGDLLGGAQTGTGKTAGFTLPLLQRLARYASTSTSPARHMTRALILAPTRELAMQVHESVRTYSKHLPLRSTCIYGGVDMRAQVAELRQGIEIVVGPLGVSQHRRLGPPSRRGPHADERSRRARSLSPRVRPHRRADAVQHVPPLHGG